MSMRIVSGRVIRGKVVVDGARLDEGASVTVLVRDADETFAMTAEAEAALLEAIAEADRGDVISAEAVVAKLRPVK